jgi:MoaA/NifB/PqqE/SkfB family radical SAM enzyme
MGDLIGNVNTLQTTSGQRQLTRRGVLWVGLHCNVRCKFCYDENVPAAQKEWVPLDQIEQAFEKFGRVYGNEYVDLMGGEPTLHPKINEIVRGARRAGLKPTIITHGMGLERVDAVREFKAAGIHDFLVSIHAVGDLANSIHGAGSDNFGRQIRGLRNLREAGIPFRFNCTVIRDNLEHLPSVARLAVSEGARVLNFLTFNPYFEWAEMVDIPFQARHSEAANYLREGIRVCEAGGVECNVRYMPLCTLRGFEKNVFTGFQLPYDTHEWDYNSWYDMRSPARPDGTWYLAAACIQRQRHKYTYLDACNQCAARSICDGFSSQYVTRFGSEEAQPYSGPSIQDPAFFIRAQEKFEYGRDAEASAERWPAPLDAPLRATQFNSALENRAGIKITLYRRGACDLE